MGRAPCCDKANVKKGPWSPEEDMKLKQFIEKHGTGGNWIALPHKAGLKRCGKSCRLRWLNYLRPNIKHGEFSDDEDRIICTLFASIGSRWSIIAAQLPGRTDNDIKNYWNTKLKKKLMAASMVPLSHTNISHPQPPYPSSLQTSPSTYKASSGMISYNLTNLQEPMSLMPSNLLMNNLQKNTTNPTTTTLQVQEMNFMGSMQHFYPAKGSPHQVFGVGGEPSCSSSDGSCNQFSYGEGGGPHNGGDQQMGLEGYFYNGVGGFLGGSTSTPPPPPLDYYNLEEIKQFITSSSSSSNGNGCNDFFNIDETKTQGKVMY